MKTPHPLIRRALLPLVLAGLLASAARAATYDWSTAFSFNNDGFGVPTFSKAYQDLTITVTDNSDSGTDFYWPTASTNTSTHRLIFSGASWSNSADTPVYLKITKTDASAFTPTGTLTLYYETYNAAPVVDPPDPQPPAQYQSTTVEIKAYSGATVTGTTSQPITGVGSFTITFSSLTGFSNITALEFNNGKHKLDIGTLTLGSTNSAPTNIALSAATINQSAATANATIGTLSTTDADGGDTFTYALVGGTGSTNNASFAISGSSLRVGGTALAAGTYAIRVQTTDSASNTFQKQFSVTVTDNVGPTVTSIVRLLPSTAQNTTSASATFRVTFSEAVNAPVAGNFEVAAVSSTIVGTVASVSAVSTSVYDVAVTITSGSGEFRLKVKD